MAWTWFRGDYSTWDEAASQSGGYAAPQILERVLAATRKVRDGDADYERDGVAFRGSLRNQPLIDAIGRASNPGLSLRVIDVGGALGSTYWQRRKALAGLLHLQWRVVEQASYVEVGSREFQNRQLTFWPDLQAASAGFRPDLVLLSSVVQYVRDPYALIREVARLEPPWLFFDRLPLLDGARDLLTVEHAPPDIGQATYPAWFLSEQKFVAAVSESYRQVDSFRTCLEDGVPERWDLAGTIVDNQGFLFRLRE